MNYRSVRIILLLGLLMCLLALPGFLTARATASSTRAERSFQPTGHGVVVPQKINAANLSKVHTPQSVALQSATTSIQQAVTKQTGFGSLPLECGQRSSRQQD